MAKKRTRGVNTGSILFKAESSADETPDAPATSQPAAIQRAADQKAKSFLSGLGSVERIAAIGVCLLLVVVGALGATGFGEKIISMVASPSSGQKTNRTGSAAQNGSALTSLNPFAAPAVSPTPQLSKEYIYAGSRLLAVEDANASASGSPSPSATPTATPPTGTPTPTPPTQQPGSYNAVADFSLTNNPTTYGAWSYGYQATAFSTFALYTGSGMPWTNIRVWSTDGGCCLMVAKSTTGAAADYASITQPADVLNLHPGPNGERSVVRWTAPQPGTYQVAGRFEGIDRGHTSTIVRIMRGTQLLQQEVLFGYGTVKPFNQPVTITAAGETIDFSVDYGENQTYNSDSTGLAANINLQTSAPSPTPTPSPSPSPTPSVIYDAVNDFPTGSGQKRPWSYGAVTQSGTFVQHTNTGVPWANIRTWSASANGGCCLMVGKNTTAPAQTVSYATIVQPADVLNLHPGATGEQSVVRWTAPQSRLYRIYGRFQGLDTGGTTTDVHILHNGAAIWNGTVDGYGAQATYTIPPIQISLGDTIDFVVGYGNGTYNSDSTGLAAIITTNLYASNTTNLFRIETILAGNWLGGIGGESQARIGGKDILPSWAKPVISGE